MQNAPELLIGLEVYYSAFWELATCRQIGMGMGPIPWTAIDRYAVRHRLENEDFDALLYMVRKMDDAWLEHQSEEAKKRTSK